MAFNTSPKVADARNIAQKWNKTKVIIIMIDDNAGTMEYASYGQTTHLCSEAQKLADAAYNAVYKKLEESNG